MPHPWWVLHTGSGGQVSYQPPARNTPPSEATKTSRVSQSVILRKVLRGTDKVGRESCGLEAARNKPGRRRGIPVGGMGSRGLGDEDRLRDGLGEIALEVESRR